MKQANTYSKGHVQNGPLGHVQRASTFIKTMITRIKHCPKTSSWIKYYPRIHIALIGYYTRMYTLKKYQQRKIYSDDNMVSSNTSPHQISVKYHPRIYTSMKCFPRIMSRYKNVYADKVSSKNVYADKVLYENVYADRFTCKQ